ncbi:MAG: dihydrolipoyl dehydrogenase [Clostridia bacterium]|nr:dihydrolipoyl dehydrogenase [Clostridia bacterium]
MFDFDLIVVGAGPGGYEAALHAAKLGLKTAVVERREVGGTCLNRGCIPTKALLHASTVYEEAKSGAALGVNAEGLTYDLSAMFAYKAQVVEKLRGGIESLFKAAKVPLLRGTGTLTATNTISVSGENEGVYTARSILLATGSVPARPPIPGLDLPGVMTSDELLAGEGGAFSSLIIIGGGVIGMEFATFYNDLGVDVTVVEGLDRLLPNMDRELGQNLAMIMKKRGVQVFTGAMVKDLTATETGIQVNFETKGKLQSVTGEKVLCAIGRSPYTAGLFAEGMAPEMDRRRIKVNEKFETSLPGVYAIGDVSSPVQLAHVATAQGIYAVNEIAGKANEMDLSLVPGCVYVRPEIAAVGLTEAEAKDRGIPVKTAKALMSSNGRTVILSGDRGFMKLIAHAETKRLLGAQFMCTNASDMISQLSEAIANGQTPNHLLRAMRPHPTFEEALTGALEELSAKLA